MNRPGVALGGERDEPRNFVPVGFCPRFVHAGRQCLSPRLGQTARGEMDEVQRLKAHPLANPTRLVDLITTSREAGAV